MGKRIWLVRDVGLDPAGFATFGLRLVLRIS